MSSKKKKKKFVKKGIKSKGSANSKKKKKPKGKCFYCGQEYWKTNFLDYLAKVSQAMVTISSLGNALFIETCLDPGATNHICNSLVVLVQKNKSFSDGEISLRL